MAVVGDGGGDGAAPEPVALEIADADVPVFWCRSTTAIFRMSRWRSTAEAYPQSVVVISPFTIPMTPRGR